MNSSKARVWYDENIKNYNFKAVYDLIFGSFMFYFDLYFIQNVNVLFNTLSISLLKF